MFQAFRKIEIIAVFIGFFGFSFDYFGNNGGRVLKLPAHGSAASLVLVDVFCHDVAGALQHIFNAFELIFAK